MSLDWTAVITAVVTAVVSIMGTWFTLVSKKREGQLDFFEKMLADGTSLRETILQINGHNLKLQAEIDAVREELQEVKDRLIDCEKLRLDYDFQYIVYNIFNYITLPAWLCDVQDNKWYVNDVYAKHFKINRQGFWTPINIMALFDEDLSAEYMANNMKAIQFGAPIITKEPIYKDLTSPVSLNNPSEDWHILKIPILGSQKYIIGIGFPPGKESLAEFMFDE